MASTNDLTTRLRAMSRYAHDDHSIGEEAADEIERLRAALESIDRYSVSTLRTNSKDRGDWAEDMAFVGKLARGH